MLCGRPPFETSTLKETYERIAATRYTFPSHVAPAARDLIGHLLSHYPHDRPSLSAILRHDFFTCGYMPTSLNVNSCYTAPKFPAFDAPRYFSLYGIIFITPSYRHHHHHTWIFCSNRQNSKIRKEM